MPLTIIPFLGPSSRSYVTLGQSKENAFFMLPKRKGRQIVKVVLWYGEDYFFAALLNATFDSLPSGLKECYHNVDHDVVLK
jgi:hypothetical protein